MKLKSKFMRSVAFILLFLITAYVIHAYQSAKLEDQRVTVPVLVATQDILPYQEITADNTKMEERVKSDIPSDALLKASDLQQGNSFAPALGYMKGAMIQKEYINTASESQKGSSVALKKGEYQIGVSLDLTTAAGGEVRSGTTVDVLAFINGGQGRIGQTESNPQLKNITVVKVVNSQGIAVEQGEGSNNTPAVAVLKVSGVQRDLIVGYQENGKVYLSPAGEQEK